MTVNTRFDSTMQVRPVAMPGVKASGSSLDSVTKSQIKFVAQADVIQKPVEKPVEQPDTIEKIIAAHLAGRDMSLDTELTSVCIKA